MEDNRMSVYETAVKRKGWAISCAVALALTASVSGGRVEQTEDDVKLAMHAAAEAWRPINAESIGEFLDLLHARTLDDAAAMQLPAAAQLADAARAEWHAQLLREVDAMLSYWATQNVHPDSGALADLHGREAAGQPWQGETAIETLRNVWRLPIDQGRAFVAVDFGHVALTTGSPASRPDGWWWPHGGAAASRSSFMTDPEGIGMIYLRAVHQTYTRDSTDVVGSWVCVEAPDGRRFILRRSYYYCEPLAKWLPWGLMAQPDSPGGTLSMRN